MKRPDRNGGRGAGRGAPNGRACGRGRRQAWPLSYRPATGQSGCRRGKGRKGLEGAEQSPRAWTNHGRQPAEQRVCKNLQAVPAHASKTAIERPRCGTADPDFPGSAAICGYWSRPITPEAAGSSPVDPANYLPVSYFHCSVDRVDLRPRSRRLERSHAARSKSSEERKTASVFGVGVDGRRRLRFAKTCHQLATAAA